MKNILHPAAVVLTLTLFWGHFSSHASARDNTCTRVYSIAYSSTGDTLAVGGGLSVWLYDANDLSQPPVELRATRPPLFNISSLEFSPDDNFLAVGYGDSQLGGFVSLWNIESQSIVSDFGQYPGTSIVDDVTFNSDGTLVAFSTSITGVIDVWEVETVSQASIFWENYAIGISVVEFNPSDNTLASGSFDGFIRIWDVEMATIINELDYGDAIRSLDFNHDGTLLAFGTHDGKVSIWNQENRNITEITEQPDSILKVDFIGTTPQLVSIEAGGSIAIWDIDRGDQISSFEYQFGQLLGASVSPDGTKVAVLGIGENNSNLSLSVRSFGSWV